MFIFLICLSIIILTYQEQQLLSCSWKHSSSHPGTFQFKILPWKTLKSNSSCCSFYTSQQWNYTLMYMFLNSQFFPLTSPCTRGIAPIAFCRAWTSAVGPVIIDVPVSTMASQPVLHRLSWLPTVILSNKTPGTIVKTGEGELCIKLAV